MQSWLLYGHLSNTSLHIDYGNAVASIQGLTFIPATAALVLGKAQPWRNILPIKSGILMQLLTGSILDPPPHPLVLDLTTTRGT